MKQHYPLLANNVRMLRRWQDALQSRGIAVFYDGFEKVQLWGKDLVEELHNVFANRADHVVMFISQEYVEKVWPDS